MTVWTRPNVVTMLRGLLILPFLFLLNDPSPAVLLFGVGLWVLDLADGALARHRGETTALGAHLDSIVDKTSFGLVFVAIFLYEWIPLWVFLTIAILQTLQLALTFTVYRRRDAKPVTGMMFVAGLALGLSLLTNGEVKEIFYWAAVLASANHLYYYARPLFRRRQRRRIKRSVVNGNPLLLWLLAYVEKKFIRRDASFYAPRRWFTLANAVTCFRLVIAGLLLDELWSQHWVVAGVFGAFFILLDLVDGHVARATHTESMVGKVLDILVDKAVLFAVIAVLSLQGFFPMTVVGVVLTRYVVVGICAFLLFFTFKKPLPFSRWSALANIAFFLLILHPTPWWGMLVVGLQLQQLLQYLHDSYRLIDHHHVISS